jgi:hypothetical protein
MSALLNTHKPHRTHADPSAEIKDILLAFSGHFAPGLPVISFIFACPT